MDRDIDGDNDDDLRLLSERVLPSTLVSSSNNTSPRNSNRIRSLKPQKRLSSDNHIYNESDGPLPTIANTGDIIQLNDGTRKKYNGSSWRRMCSKANCSYYTQSSGLCKPHLAAMKKRQTPSTSKDTPQVNVEAVPLEQPSSKTKEPRKGDIIVLSNGIRKKYDGRQYRRICANFTCAAVVHGSLEYQNGLCPHHYQEYRSKDLSQSTSSPEPPAPSRSPSPPPPAVSPPAPSRKRRRAPSPSTSETKSSLPKSNHRLSIATVPSTVDMKNPNKGDIIEMENGSRKKFDGVVWRKICSIPDCFIAAQRDELCRKHFIKLNGKPNTLYTTDILGSVSMVPPVSKSLSSMSASSIDEKFGSQSSKKLREESRDYDDDDNEQEEVHLDQLSNLSDHEPHEQNGVDRDHSFTIDDDHFGAHLDHSLIDALSASRQKFPTNYLKKWLREHRVHPYPSNQEKLELANQSSITYDQVTTWFNNARAILRRQQAKLRQSLDKTRAEEVEEHDDDDGDADTRELIHENHKRSDSNQRISSRAPRPLPVFNGVCCRSIGVQCNPSTANQTTATSSEASAMTDEEIRADRTMRILTPSASVLRSLSLKRSASQEFLTCDVKIEDDDDDGTNNEQMIITSTCLDDEQMTRVKDFCSRFHIEFSNAVDQRTTHLITDEEEGETLVCPLSKKVIQAVARHMYIITYRWIDACLRANEIINEKPFEIQGDLTLSSDHHGMQRSRQSVPSPNLPKSNLLENYSIMIKCDGCQEMMNTDELIELVLLGSFFVKKNISCIDKKCTTNVFMLAFTFLLPNGFSNPWFNTVSSHFKNIKSRRRTLLKLDVSVPSHCQIDREEYACGTL